MAILSFTDALAASNKGARHLLLGNGFSRAIFDSVFNYSALFARAQVKLTSTAAQSFKALATTNFEEVMRALKSATALASIYAASMPSAAAAMQKDLDAIRDLLAETIAESHPNRPHGITPEQYSSCKQFLEPFGNIYTCNYDLLLYWTVMQNEVEPHVRSDDGFRHPDDPADYVVWEVQNTNSQNIHYLHGALHIYDAGHEIKKYTWVRTDVPLPPAFQSSFDGWGIKQEFKPEQSVEAYDDNVWLYAAVNKIAYELARIPLKLAKVNAKGEVQYVEKHQALETLNKPQPIPGGKSMMTSMDLKIITALHRMLAGEGYWVLDGRLSERVGGAPTVIQIAQPQFMYPRIDKNGILQEYI